MKFASKILFFKILVPQEDFRTAQTLLAVSGNWGKDIDYGINFGMSDAAQELYEFEIQIRRKRVTRRDIRFMAICSVDEFRHICYLSVEYTRISVYKFHYCMLLRKKFITFVFDNGERYNHLMCNFHFNYIFKRMQIHVILNKKSIKYIQKIILVIMYIMLSFRVYSYYDKVVSSG